MKHTLTQLISHREMLIAQAAAERHTLAQCLQPWRPRLAIADRGLAILRYASRHPVLLVTITLTIAALRPQRAGAWLKRGWIMWQLSRRILWR
jgi:hypothetical protein